jgi:hypothetical protein
MKEMKSSPFCSARNFFDFFELTVNPEFGADFGFFGPCGSLLSCRSAKIIKSWVVVIGALYRVLRDTFPDFLGSAYFGGLKKRCMMCHPYCMELCCSQLYLFLFISLFFFMPRWFSSKKKIARSSLLYRTPTYFCNKEKSILPSESFLTRLEWYVLIRTSCSSIWNLHARSK